MALLFENYYTKADKATFLDKLIKVTAPALNVDPNWLMAVFFSESGVNPQAQNTSYPFADGYATGLIQFIPATARALGTTTQALYNMTGTQQLDYVYKYFAPYIGKLTGVETLYLVTFFPAALSQYDNDAYVFGNGTNISPYEIARMNPVLDANGNGTVTMAEFKQFIRNKFKGYPSLFEKKSNLTTNAGLYIAGAIVLGLGGWYLYNESSFTRAFSPLIPSLKQ